jgi:hypothetical protein
MSAESVERGSTSAGLGASLECASGVRVEVSVPRNVGDEASAPDAERTEVIF